MWEKTSLQATTQLKDIINEENKYVAVGPGGMWLPYLTTGNYVNYRFATTHYVDDWDLAKVFVAVAKEFIGKISENRTVMMIGPWQMTELDYRHKKEWIPPVYVEDGLMQQFKEELAASGRRDIAWEDYMWYEEKKTKTLILKRDTVIRTYYRDTYILSEKVDYPIIDRIMECSMEGSGDVGIRTFFRQEEPDIFEEGAVRRYAKSSNYILQVGFGKKGAAIVIRNNPRHISYREILETIEPIFNKYGLILTEKENPYKEIFDCEGECHQCTQMCRYNLTPEYREE